MCLLGKTLLKEENQKNFHRKKLAEKLGITIQTLSNWGSDITSLDLR